MTPRCSHGGCQTDAVVLIWSAHSLGNAQFGIDAKRSRPACRNHMATICEEHPRSTW